MIVKDFLITIRFKAAGLFVRVRSRKFTGRNGELLKAENGR